METVNLDQLLLTVNKQEWHINYRVWDVLRIYVFFGPRSHWLRTWLFLFFFFFLGPNPFCLHRADHLVQNIYRRHPGFYQVTDHPWACRTLRHGSWHKNKKNKLKRRCWTERCFFSLFFFLFSSIQSSKCSVKPTARRALLVLPTSTRGSTSHPGGSTIPGSAEPWPRVSSWSIG